MSTAVEMLDQKPLATLKARAALWGATLHALEGDDGRPMLIVTRWQLTKSFSDLGQVSTWLDKVGARPA